MEVIGQALIDKRETASLSDTCREHHSQMVAIFRENNANPDLITQAIIDDKLACRSTDWGNEDNKTTGKGKANRKTNYRKQLCWRATTHSNPQRPYQNGLTINRNMADPGTHNKKEKTERPKKTLPKNTT